MNLDAIKKASKIVLLGFASIGLFSCDDATNSELPSSEEPITPSIPSSEEESNEKGLQILSTLKDMKESQNYTAEATDSLGAMTQYFMPDFYAYKFEGVSSTTMFGYCEDELGIYAINVNSTTGKVLKHGYYEVDQYGNKLTDLYANAVYSLKNLSFKDSDYEAIGDKLYITNLRSNDALVLYVMFGYQENDSYQGIYFSQLDDLYFEYTDDNNIKMSLVFDATKSQMGTSVMTFTNINTTKKPSCYDEFYKAGNKGKIRVEREDELFTHLQSLKNMRNYTVNIDAHYKETQWGNRSYTTQLKFDNDCYYSVSSRSTDTDLGFIVQDGVVKSCLLDAVSNKLIVGDTYQDSNGSTKSNIFDVVYSFYDLYWNEYTIGAIDVEENKWNIDDADIIETFAYLVNDTFLRYQWQSIDFTYDPVKLEYHFHCNLTDDEYILVDVVDVNSTVIYQKN